MKKLVLLVSIVSALCFVSACKGKSESGSAAKKHTLKVGDVWGPTHPMGKAMADVFKTQIEQKTNGSVTVDIYSDGTLGNEADLWNGVRNGTIEAVVIGTVFNQEWPMALIAEWPFLYRDLAHAQKVWTGPVADELSAEFRKKFPSVEILGWGPNSARTFTSNKKLTSVDDFKGQKFRVPANPVHMGIVDNLGASAQVIPLTDLFSALETGVVDGQDNGMVTVLSQHFDQVQKYVYETNHLITTTEIVVSLSFLQKLPDEYQQIIRDAGRAATLTAWNDYVNSVDRDRKKLQDSGLTVTPCSPEDQQRIINMIEPLTDKLYADYTWAKALTDRIKAE